MSPLAATLRLDATVQARSQLYSIGVGVAVAFGLFARFLIGPEHATKGAPILYLLSIGGTTYMFGASMVLLEKSQGTLDALRTSPLRRHTYLTSKLVTLTGFAALEGAIMHAVGFWGVGFSPLPLVVGVLALGVLNTLVGLGQVAPHDSLFSFLVPGAMIVGSALQWPFLGAMDLGPAWVWMLFPTQGPLLLMLGAFETLPTGQWVFACASTAVWIVVAALWASRRFATHIGLGD